jgi:hypothetical protein
LLNLDGNQISDDALKAIKEHLEAEKKSSILGEMENNDNEYTSEDFEEIKGFFA